MFDLPASSLSKYGAVADDTGSRRSRLQSGKTATSRLGRDVCFDGRRCFDSIEEFVFCSDLEYVVDPAEQYVNPDPEFGGAPIDLSGWAEPIERWRKPTNGAGL